MCVVMCVSACKKSVSASAMQMCMWHRVTGTAHNLVSSLKFSTGLCMHTGVGPTTTC